MGNSQTNKGENIYSMNIKYIGKNLKNFVNLIKSSNKLKCIKNFWKFEQLEDNRTIMEQLNNYFNILEKDKEDTNFNKKNVLIVKVKNIFEPEVNCIYDKINKLEETYYMPLVLILFEEEKEEKISKDENSLLIDTNEYENLDPRLFKKEKYTEDSSIFKKKIAPILLRFCSIHNELGDRFSIEEKENFDLTKINFPFNVNIACLGQCGKGKSTAINAITKSYKAKESSKGCSQTKSITYYQVENYPIRILDIPGFEDENTVKQAVEKFKFCREEINKMKEKLHIILYFFNYNDNRAFIKSEYLMLDEILKHDSSKIIYVITKSNHNLKDKNKRKVIERINTGLKEMFKNKKENENISNDNNNIQKIINEKTPLNSSLNQEEYNKYEKLKATIDNTVFVNFHKNDFEPFGEDDLFKKIHDFFIESDDYKNSNKELNDQIIEERAMKLREEAKKILLSNKIWGSVVGILPAVDWALQKFVIKKNAAKKVGRIFGVDIKFVKEQAFASGARVAAESGAYIGGGTALGTGIARYSTAIAEGLEVGASIGLKVIGISVAVVGCGIGVGVGGYLTHKYCEELLDEFVKYYKNNASSLENSYDLAANYFLSNINNIVTSINDS